MPSKTIVGIIGTTIITMTLIITGADDFLIYAGLSLIALLCGVSLIKNNFTKK